MSRRKLIYKLRKPNYRNSTTTTLELYDELEYLKYGKKRTKSIGTLTFHNSRAFSKFLKGRRGAFIDSKGKPWN